MTTYKYSSQEEDLAMVFTESIGVPSKKVIVSTWWLVFPSLATFAFVALCGVSNFAIPSSMIMWLIYHDYNINTYHRRMIWSIHSSVSMTEDRVCINALSLLWRLLNLQAEILATNGTVIKKVTIFFDDAILIFGSCQMGVWYAFLGYDRVPSETDCRNRYRNKNFNYPRKIFWYRSRRTCSIRVWL